MAPRFILGVIIVLVGVSLLLDQLDFEPAGHVMRFWPVILVAVGFLSLSRGRRGSVTGVVLIFLGGWLLPSADLRLSAKSLKCGLGV